MKKGGFVLVVIITVMWVLPAFAELRQVHRASQLGGTGMLFQRTGDQLDPKEMNASIFIEYMMFSTIIPLNPHRNGEDPYLDDPRGDAELWTTLTFNYGINHIIELGVQVPLVYTMNPRDDSTLYVYSSDEYDFKFKNDIREDGLGRIGVDARFMLLNRERMGGGISSTLWLSAPSFQDSTSDGVNGGIELNFLLDGGSFTNYFAIGWLDEYFLKKIDFCATWGWGFDDYLLFERNDPYPSYPGPHNPLYNLTARNPRRPEWVNAEFMKASLGAEYEIYDRTFVGTEFLWKQYPNEYHNDNNMTLIFPEVSYTHEDKFTVQGAFGWGGFMRVSDSQPEFLGKVGLTYHFPQLVRKPHTERVIPGRPQDVFDIFVPSRKPVPIQTEDEETILPGDEEIIIE